jgi:hypothetical protein
MISNPANTFTTRFQTRSVLTLLAVIAWVAATFVIFFQVVIPSFENGTTSETFSVDSTVYVYFADTLREGRYDPWVIESLAHFPNTTWTPVLMSLVFESYFKVMLANYVIFAISIFLLKKTFPISLATLLPLLLLNPTTTTSILCVNKEIFDLLNLSIFLYSRVRKNNWLLLAALGFALINRFEFCAVMVLFIISESRLNPFRGRRLATLLFLVIALNFVMPFFEGEMLAQRFEEAASGHAIAVLDTLQMHYLYVLAVLPKIAENMFGQLLNPQVWIASSSWLFINLFNNLAYVVVIAIAANKRVLTLKNDLVYFAAFGAVLAAQSLAVQPRYFQFVYVLLCLEIAQLKVGDHGEGFTRQEHPENDRYVLVWGRKQAAAFSQFG